LAGTTTALVGFAFAEDALKDFKAGNMMESIGSALGTVAMASIYYKKGKYTNGIIVIKTALEVVDGVFNNKWDQVKNAIADAFILGGAASMFTNPLAAAALFAIGYSLKFITIEDIDRVKKYIVDKIVTPIDDAFASGSSWIKANVVPEFSDRFGTRGRWESALRQSHDNLYNRIPRSGDYSITNPAYSGSSSINVNINSMSMGSSTGSLHTQAALVGQQLGQSISRGTR